MRKFLALFSKAQKVVAFPLTARVAAIWVLVLLLGVGQGMAQTRVPTATPPITPTNSSGAPVTPTTPSTPATPSTGGGTTTPATTTPPAGGTTATPAAPINNWYNQPWMKDLFTALEDTRVDYGKRAVLLFSQDISDLTIVCLGLWLLWQAGSLLLPFGPGGRAGMILNATFQRVLLAIVILFLLKDGAFYTKIYDAIGSAGSNAAAFYVTTAMNKYDKASSNDSCAKSPTLTAESDEVDRAENVVCLTLLMQKAIGVGYQIGANTMETHRQDYWQTPFAQGDGNKMMDAVAGIPLILVFGWAMIQIPFRMMNLLLQLTLVTMLSPALIACYLFPFSRKVAIGGVKLLVHSAVTLVFMAVVIAIMLAMLTWVGAEAGKPIADLGTYALKNSIGDAVFWNFLVVGLLSNAMMGYAPMLATYSVSLPVFANIPEAFSNALNGAFSGARGLFAGMAGKVFNGGRGAQAQRIAQLRAQISRRSAPPPPTPPTQRTG